MMVDQGEALRESEERYRTVVQLSPSGIFIHVDGKVVFANQSFARMSGAARPEELYGTSVLDFVHADHLDLVADRMRMIKTGRQQTPLAELKVVRLDGPVIDVEVTGFPFNYKGHDTTMVFMEDITQRKKAEARLKKREKELEKNALDLQEANAALKVLLRHREEDKTTLENAILTNVKELIFPYIEKLRHTYLSDSQTMYLGILESGLNEIVSPFLQRMTAIYSHFTPTEIQVANLIRSGKTSKEIAELLNVSAATVDTHRNNIRNKLGLRNNKNISNLRSLSPFIHPNYVENLHIESIKTQ